MFLSTNLIINGYKKGIFPMAESANDPYVYWVSPNKRGIISLDEFNVPKSLKKFLKKNIYTIGINSKFKDVINSCAKSSSLRSETWINNQIIENYTELFFMGLASSIEIYQKKDLVGGLYGVQLGSIFFGESMFSTQPNASKVALVYLAALLKQSGFNLIDTQFLTEHLKQFGAKEIDKKNYIKILEKNLKLKKKFPDKLNKDLLSYF